MTNSIHQELAAAISRVRAHSEAQATKPLAFVLTFGCQQNEADSEKIRGLADEMGYGRAETAEEADLILVNTCAVREHAEQKALSIIGQFKHIKEKRPHLIIGVCGCMTAQERRVEEIKKKYPYVSFTIEPSAIDRIPAVVADILHRRRRIFVLEQAAEITEGVPIARSSSHRAWVSIMYGCNNFCSYCIVPYVRGRERSRGEAGIIREVEGLVAAGVKDITLLGQNVNSYQGRCGDFTDLLERLDAIEGEYVLRFMTSHPKDVPDKLIDFLGRARHVEPHFHLPLQSGSDRILKAMNRRYDVERYLSVVDKLRAVRPEISLTSDIIVAFPGESEEDFEETLEILRRVRFDGVYSFIYSPRSGTPAALLEGRVPKAVSAARMQRLLDLQGEIARENNQAHLHRTLRVLVDGLSKNDPTVYSGRTDEGKLVHTDARAEDVGKFVKVYIDRAEAFALYGTVVRP